MADWRDTRRGCRFRGAAVCRAAHSTASDGEAAAGETRAEAIRVCRKRSFATHRQGRRPTSAAACRIPCLILCLADVERACQCHCAELALRSEAGWPLGSLHWSAVHAHRPGLISRTPHPPDCHRPAAASTRRRAWRAQAVPGFAAWPLSNLKSGFIGSGALQSPATSDASSQPALLLRQMQAVFSVVAPCPRGASLASVRRRTFTTYCSEGKNRE